MIWSVCILNDYILQFSIGSYGGDIYNNMLVMIGSGSIAIGLSYLLIRRMHPALALSTALLLTLLPSLVYFAVVHHRVQLGLDLDSLGLAATVLLSLAKLGAATAHSLAFLFVVWQFKSS